MSEESLTPQQVAQVQANAQAYAEVLKQIIPQAFSSKSLMDEGRGLIDEWKMSKISGRAMLSLIYFRHRGVNDNIRFYKEFTDHFLRGSHSIEGLGLKLLESISIGLAGGGGKRKLMKKPGWIGRHITKRDWERKAERDQAQVVE